MSQQGHKTEGVKRIQTMWFYSFIFTGKERDEETGYGYFGARYMDHELMTMWLSVDPMADKYLGVSPYAYCAWNPVKLVDPDGREIWKPEMYRNGDIYYRQEHGDNISTLQKQYGLSEDQAKKLYGAKKNGRISGESVNRTIGSPILKVDWNHANDEQKIYQAFFAILHGISIRRGAKADMNNFFSNLPHINGYKRTTRGWMGISDNVIDIRGNFLIPLMDGNEVVAKYASLTISQESSVVANPQPPSQIEVLNSKSDWKQVFCTGSGNYPKITIILSDDNIEDYLNSYY